LTFRVQPAEVAVGFTREVQSQLARFPLAESASKQPYLKCPICRQFKIMDVPPLFFMDVRLLKCDQCAHVYDPSMKEWDLRVYRSKVEAAMAGREEAA